MRVTLQGASTPSGGRDGLTFEPVSLQQFVVRTTQQHLDDRTPVGAGAANQKEDHR